MEIWKKKVAVVTGASSGIGKALVISLGQHGVTVVGLARRTGLIENIANENKELPGKIYPKECDIMDRSAIYRVFDWIEQTFGSIDILINNAGTRRTARIMDTEIPDEDITLAIDTNLTGLLICTRRALKVMKTQSSGYIININSIGGHVWPTVDLVSMGDNVYCATKHAVTNLTEMLRLELAVAGVKHIRVSSVSPGLVETGFREAAGSDSKVYKSLPVLQPEDIADSVIYLLGTKSSVNVTELIIRPNGETL